MTFSKAIAGKVLLAVLTSSVFAMSTLPLAAQAGEVWNRVENQQDRIQQGVRNGSLSFGEYRWDENHLAAINAQRKFDLRHDGGHLTAAQYHRLNRELNTESERIYWTKHN